MALELNQKAVNPVREVLIMSTSNESLSVLFITQHFPPETGAPSTRVDNLTKRWNEVGHDVTVLTSAPDYPEGELYDGYENEWLQREERDGVTVYMTKTIPASNEGFIQRGFKFVWFMIMSILFGLRLARPDVVIATTPQPFTGVSGLIIARLRRAKFVFEVRDLWPESITAVSEFGNRPLLKALKATVNFVYRRADRIVVVSKRFTPTLGSVGVDENDIWYHPNGVEPEFFEHSGSWRISEELQRTLDEKFVVSYVGTLGRAHGLTVVIDAAEKLQLESRCNDILFAFVGYGANADKLEQMATERGLENVLFVGRRPKDEVPDVLELSDVSLVHLKDRELFKSAIPSKMFEAMASGTPIALGVRGEAERIVKSGDVGVPFEPENAKELAETVLELQNDSEMRARLGENGTTYVSENFSWDSIADDYRANFESLVENEAN